MDISEIRRENLRQLVGQFKTTAEFARRYRVDATYVSQLLNRHRNFGEKAARNMEGKLGLDDYALDSSAAAEVRENGPIPYQANVSPGPEVRGRVPLISWVRAGDFCEAVDLFEPGDAEDWLPCPGDHSDRTYALRVDGDSMTSPYPGQRSYPKGTIIFVDPDRPVTNGCRVVAKIDDDVTFKTYSEDMGKKYLRPINPAWDSRDITDLAVTICGVVIGSYMPE